MPTPEELLARLRTIPYPGFSRDIVSFGLVRDIEVSSRGVTVKLAPSTAKDEVVREIAQAVYQTLSSTPGVTGEISIVREQAEPAPARRGPQAIPGVDRVLAISSGKGGVGKSTVATNLAL